jgi:magnesium transporter
VAVGAALVDAAGLRDVDDAVGEIDRHLADDEFFWLDLHDPAEADLRAVGERLNVHPLALEDSLEFGRRAKAEDYETFLFLVVFGWSPDADWLVEVHVFYSERFLVTVHRDESPVLDALRRSGAAALGQGTKPIILLHGLVDGLTDSFVAPLEDIEDRLEAIEAEIVSTPHEHFVGEILSMRRRVALLRKTLDPERDVLGRITTGVVSVPGMTPDAERYFRDVHDNLVRLTEMLDVARELITGALDVYLSAASNRLGVVTKQLTVIATIFLPLTFITGFFGQNFGWLVRNVGSWEAFLLLGIGLELAVLAAIVAIFRVRRLF